MNKVIDNLKTILRIVWISVGILFISLIIFTGIQINSICEDIRDVTSKMTVDDMRKVLDIVENQQQIKLRENK